MSPSILVVLQQRDGALHRMSREAIAAGQRLAASTSGSVSALLLGDGLDEVAAEVGAYDLSEVVTLSDPALASYTPGAWVEALVGAVEALSPDVLLLPHTYQSVDFMGLLAQRLGAALVPEATGFESGGERVVWQRPVLGGKLVARVAPRGEGLVVVSLQSGSFAADEATAGEAGVRALDPAGSPAPDREILGTEEVGGDQVDLTQASAIVAVGRGIGEADKLETIETLARLLGAEIAASRPVIDNGWLPRDRQIGSSGQTVAPKLYLALGISGAIQHLVGMKGSKTVVAVNRDASAPIFAVSDYGYVGDLHEFVPALIAALESSAES